MVFFNHATRQMTVKIVYYGPGLCGKTTNLNTIYGKTSQKARGEMVSLNTETDRTLFFDLLPMDVGMVGGFKTKLQLYTVPGQVFYNSTRKLVLKGVDGIVFVVDSQTPMLDAGKESWQNLDANLRELGLSLGDIPLVFQWNKRDLKNVVPVEELENAFNAKGLPSFQSVASDGSGVFETLRGITKLALTHIKTNVLGESQGQAPSAPPAPVPVAPSHLPPPVLADPEAEALTLSDLPTVHDLLDMEGARSRGSLPLPDEDDEASFDIEAPFLPEPPEDATLAFLEDDEGDLPPSALPDELELPEPPQAASAMPAPLAPVAEPQPPTPEIFVAPAALVPPPTPEPLRPAAKSIPKADPFAALAGLKVDTKKPAVRPKATDPKDAISSLMGELTMVGRQGAPSVLRLELPGDLDGQEVEVVVQLRHRGQVIAEGQVQRPAPAKGSTAKLSVELKRG